METRELAREWQHLTGCKKSHRVGENKKIKLMMRYLEVIAQVLSYNKFSG